jgi:hypothetical protein
LRGDVRFAPDKEILGFDLDGEARTIRLPQRKAETIVTEVKRILKKKRVSLNRMQRIVGRLQHASLVMPATRALFSPMYSAMKGDPKYIYLPSGGLLRAALWDAIALTLEAARRPTHVNELVASKGEIEGNCDASAFAAGGVWHTGELLDAPIAWRVVWPDNIRRNVVSESNPNGKLTNSDVELAAILLHHLVLEQTMAMRHVKTVTFSDNLPAVAWVSKMTTKAESAVSYNLLRGIAMRQQVTGSVKPEVQHVEHDYNVPADTASRRVTGTTGTESYMNEPSTGLSSVSDVHFVSYFNSRFPLSQNFSWQLVHPAPELLSKVISTLRGRPSSLQQWTTKPEQRAGHGGQHTLQPSMPTPTCTECPSKASTNGSSWRLPPGFGQGTSDARSESSSKLSRKPSVTWGKPSCWQDSQIRAAHMVPKSWTYPSGTP